MNVCGMIRLYCDRAQHGYNYYTTALRACIPKATEKGKVLCTGRSTVHYRRTPWSNDTIIWLVPNSVWAHRLDTYKGLIPVSLHVPPKNNSPSMSKFVGYFQAWKKATGVHSFNWNIGIKISLRLTIYHWEHKDNFMNITIQFHATTVWCKLSSMSSINVLVEHCYFLQVSGSGHMSAVLNV